MRKKYLLGATKDNGIIFGEFEVTNRNGYPEFTASFDEVNPFTADELEDGEDYYEELLESCYDDEGKYKLCEMYNCRPSELAECMADECGTEPMDMRDCSLYPEIIDVDGIDYYFESGSCGQHDTRGEIEEYVDVCGGKRNHEKMFFEENHLGETIEISQGHENQKCYWHLICNIYGRTAATKQKSLVKSADVYKQIF